MVFSTGFTEEVPCAAGGVCSMGEACAMGVKNSASKSTVVVSSVCGWMMPCDALDTSDAETTVESSCWSGRDAEYDCVELIALTDAFD